MAAPDFHETRFPELIALGAIGGPSFHTTVVVMSDGTEQRNIDWATSLVSFDVTQGIKNQEDFNELLNFFYARQGRVIGFRFKDWSDYRLPRWIDTPGDFAPLPTLFTTDGATPTFQIAKLYGDAGGTYLRPLSKIVDGSVLLYDNGVLTTDYTVDINTGIVSLGTALQHTTAHVLTGACEFDVPVRFNMDDMSAAIDDFGQYTWSKVTLAGVRLFLDLRHTPLSVGPDVRFPEHIAMGATGGPGFKTTITTMTAGNEARNPDWRLARGQWTVSHTIQDDAQFDTLLNFFYARRGKAFSFRFKDLADYRLPPWDITPGDTDPIPTLFVTDGTTRTFQVTKVYQDLAGAYIRPISKIVVGSLVLYDNTTSLPAAFTVDNSTGIVTLDAGLAATVGHDIAGHCEFDCKVRFDIDQMQIDIVDDKIYTWSGIKLIELR